MKASPRPLISCITQVMVRKSVVALDPMWLFTPTTCGTLLIAAWTVVLISPPASRRIRRRHRGSLREARRFHRQVEPDLVSGPIQGLGGLGARGQERQHGDSDFRREALRLGNQVHRLPGVIEQDRHAARRSSPVAILWRRCCRRRDSPPQPETVALGDGSRFHRKTNVECFNLAVILDSRSLLRRRACERPSPPRSLGDQIRRQRIRGRLPRHRQPPGAHEDVPSCESGRPR